MLKRPEEVVGKRLSEHGGSSLGRSFIIRRGLSSMGVILVEITELRCESRARFSVNVQWDDGIEAVPADDPRE